MYQKKISLLILFVVSILSFYESFAGEATTIPAKFYTIDQTNKLILINQDINTINIQDEGEKQDIILDKVYSLVQSVPEFEVGKSYDIILNQETYKLFFTELPIVKISTKYEIWDAPAVHALFQIVEANGNIKESDIGIEIRGAYTQTLPKKSYEIKIWSDGTGEESQDVKFLNMRKDNRWNLQAMHNEELRIRSTTSNYLWREIYKPYYLDKEPEAINGIRSEYVELFINNEYRGVYALSEKVDRKQLKLKKYKDEIKGELYKGISWGEVNTFNKLYPFENSKDVWGGFEYKHPEEKIEWNNLYNFIDFVINSPESQFLDIYKEKFDQKNAIDYFIFLNLLWAADNTGKNLYIAKYDKGEPYFFVPWDLDGVFGRMWHGLPTEETNVILTNGFYDRLLNDCSSKGFGAKVKVRWANLRKSVITHDHIMRMFQLNHDFLKTNGVYDRESIAWPEFQYNPNELSYMSTWLKNHLSYLDNFFSNNCPSLPSSNESLSVSITPNPANNYLKIAVDDYSSPYRLTTKDIYGRVVSTTLVNSDTYILQTTTLSNGIYFLNLQQGKTATTKKIMVSH
ncbi:CotH kinase family protein [Rufibacter tibetensis]|uniref:CotH kinase family protein n=1 Tax=Rufibacter tibetensis TaxID=512763 RepID=UPI0007842254|nr:CotH kinase family protein [Rufibacter tibetensis]